MTEPHGQFRRIGKHIFWLWFAIGVTWLICSGQNNALDRQAFLYEQVNAKVQKQFVESIKALRQNQSDQSINEVFEEEFAKIRKQQLVFDTLNIEEIDRLRQSIMPSAFKGRQ